MDADGTRAPVLPHDAPGRHPADPGAFVPGPPVHRAGAADGPLVGLTFAAKDLFDLAGLVTGAGNPDWARTHAPAHGRRRCRVRPAGRRGHADRTHRHR